MLETRHALLVITQSIVDLRSNQMAILHIFVRSSFHLKTMKVENGVHNCI